MIMRYFLLPSLVHSQPFLCCHATCQHTHKKSCTGDYFFPTSLPSCAIQILLLLHQTNPNPLHWYGIQEKFEQDFV